MPAAPEDPKALLDAWDVLKLGIGTAIGAVATLVHQNFKYRFEELSDRCDDLCRTASSAADLASGYWLSEANVENGDRLTEVRLRGYQSRIMGHWINLENRFLENDVVAIRKANVHLFDALTGGTFGDSERKVDLSRAAIAQHATAELEVLLRRALRNTIPLRAAGVIAIKRFRGMWQN